MELRQLKYFVKVAELQNFTDAAKALNITQGTVSQQVKQLEAELGVRLLRRDARRVQLTEEGKALYPKAVQTISDAEMCMETINIAKGTPGGTLSIGAVYAASGFLIPIIQLILREEPNIKVRMVCGSQFSLLQMLDRNEIDIVVGFRTRGDIPEIETHQVFPLQWDLVMSETHPMAKQSHITIQDLAKCQLLVVTPNDVTRGDLELLAKLYGIKVNVRVETNDTGVLLRLIGSSHLVVMTLHNRIRDLKGVVSIPIDIPNERNYMCYHLNKLNRIRPATQIFINILKNAEQMMKNGSL